MDVSAIRSCVLIAAFALPAAAAEYCVATTGSDKNPGTKAHPFRTIQKAADVMAPGDACFVRGGVYRETVTLRRSGAEGKPLRFAAQPGEVVTLSGTELIEGKWKVHKGSIYKTQVKGNFAQLFLDGQMMLEARWPNATFAQLLTRKGWARTGKGSRYGTIVDPNLAKTGIDWTGALATMNLAHQFFTWTRLVRKHAKGDDAFEYDKDLPGITHFADKTRPWEDDWYFLSGKLEALDAPAEWFLDTKTGTLYLWAPDGKSPAGRKVEAKRRNLAFVADGIEHVRLEGFHFFAATFNFRNCRHCVIDGCHVLFPTYDRRIREMDRPRGRSAATLVAGSHNVVRNCSLAHSSGPGLVVLGMDSTVENNLIHDVCWHGSLIHSALRVGPLKRREPPNPSARPKEVESCGVVVRRNTVFNGGNALVTPSGMPGIILEYNHIFRGGLICKDVALLYTQLPHIFGTVFRYNWVHGCYTEGRHAGGLRGGLGIRGDDQTRGLTVHHNVVWDCGRDGIIVKGDFNRVCSNTVLSIGTAKRPGNYVNLHTAREPTKPWRKQFPRLARQNQHSEVFNNVALTVTGHNRGAPFPKGPNNTHNFQGREPRLRDPARWDFRPAARSPLIDAGKRVPGITGGHTGTAPDIGAYEHDGEHWIPGCRNGLWMQARKLPDAPAPGYAVRIAFAMPLLAPAELHMRMLPKGAAGPHLPRFTPANWMRPQEFKMLAAAGGEPTGWEFRVPGLGTARLDDLKNAATPHGITLWFGQGSTLGLRAVARPK